MTLPALSVIGGPADGLMLPGYGGTWAEWLTRYGRTCYRVERVAFKAPGSEPWFALFYAPDSDTMRGMALARIEAVWRLCHAVARLPLPARIGARDINCQHPHVYRAP